MLPNRHGCKALAPKLTEDPRSLATAANRPFNDLPNLPPASETETKAILRSCIAARAALAELRASGNLIPNHHREVEASQSAVRARMLERRPDYL